MCIRDSIFAKPLEIINLSALNKFEDGEIASLAAWEKAAACTVTFLVTLPLPRTL